MYFQPTELCDKNALLKRENFFKAISLVSFINYFASLSLFYFYVKNMWSIFIIFYALEGKCHLRWKNIAYVNNKSYFQIIKLFPLVIFYKNDKIS